MSPLKRTILSMKARCLLDSVSGCWLWTGPLDKDGYGIATAIYIDGKQVKRAHRVAFYMANGYLPELLDHVVCDNPACINPAHVEPSNDKQNVLRGKGPTAINAKKTHCPKGHEYSPKRTKHGIWRHCKTCKLESERRRIAKKKASEA